MDILIIANPASGSRRGLRFVEENVLPLLDDSKLPYRLEECKAPGMAGNLAAEFLKTHSNVTLIISGGDGTIHEVINGIVEVKGAQKIQLVICPQGTANALYSTLFPPSDVEPSSVEYQLQSVYAFLNGRSRPLTLTQTQLLTSGGQTTETIVGVVVTSAALHASILDSAESLRSTIDGIERFKVAAAQNISNWYQSCVRLHAPASRGSVLIYDPVAQALKPFGSSNQSCVDLPGPFEYFLSTVNVDRLEPAFEITPLFSNMPPMPGEMDLIVVRPLRSPVLESDSPRNRAAFVQTSTATVQHVYNKGNHISLAYNPDGSLTFGGDGRPVVEYIRCGSWEWTPNGSDDASHLICVDGTILKIPSGGKATCCVLTGTTNARFAVCG